MEYNNIELKTEDAPNFWKYVQKTDTCWLWIGQKDKDGYGLVFHKGKQHRAHRLSYQLHWSVIPGSYIVRHTCDVTNCVNPDHLIFGTTKQNSQDMVNRGRSNKNKNIPRISNDIKSKIAVEYDIGLITRHGLAKKYNVNVRTVSRIIKRARSGQIKNVPCEMPQISKKEEIQSLLKRLAILIDSL
jgi:hypothetical protein